MQASDRFAAKLLDDCPQRGLGDALISGVQPNSGQDFRKFRPGYAEVVDGRIDEGVPASDGGITTGHSSRGDGGERFGRGRLFFFAPVRLAYFVDSRVDDGNHAHRRRHHDRPLQTVHRAPRGW